MRPLELPPLTTPTSLTLGRKTLSNLQFPVRAAISPLSITMARNFSTPARAVTLIPALEAQMFLR